MLHRELYNIRAESFLFCGIGRGTRPIHIESDAGVGFLHRLHQIVVRI